MQKWKIKGIKLEKELDRKVKLLEDNPYIYQRINENARRFFINKYVVIYKIDFREVIILRVLPKKSNYNTQNFEKYELKA